jgi:hypothetical protein
MTTTRYRLEPHALSDRIRGKLLFIPATGAFAVALLRPPRGTELWIGDSHAMSSIRSVTNSMFMRAPGGRFVLRAGARLMFSLARDGFPPRVTRVARLVGAVGRRGTFVPVFSAGEIDVRAHLAEHLDDSFEFVAAYVQRCVELADVLKAERLGILVPPPPVDAPVDEVWFPIVGTIEERVEAHRRVREALIEAVAAVPHAELLDATAALADEAGAMPVELTLDGSHANLEAVARIEAHLATARRS